MSAHRTATQMLNRDFLEIRHCTLEIAAALDRMERAEAGAQLRSDPHYRQLMQAVRVLIDGKADRTERVQMVFSLPHDTAWRLSFGFSGK